jgi:hypothetical protein
LHFRSFSEKDSGTGHALSDVLRPIGAVQAYISAVRKMRAPNRQFLSGVERKRSVASTTSDSLPNSLKLGELAPKNTAEIKGEFPKMFLGDKDSSFLEKG